MDPALLYCVLDWILSRLRLPSLKREAWPDKSCHGEFNSYSLWNKNSHFLCSTDVMLAYKLWTKQTLSFKSIFPIIKQIWKSSAKKKCSRQRAVKEGLTVCTLLPCRVSKAFSSVSNNSQLLHSLESCLIKQDFCWLHDLTLWRTLCHLLHRRS